MNPDGTDYVQLTNNSDPDYAGDWAPNGLKIYFTREVFDGALGYLPIEINTMASDGTLLSRLSTSTVGEGEPVASPSGLFVAYASEGVGGVEDIFKMTVGGLLPQNLTNSAGLDFSPDWSPSAL